MKSVSMHRFRARYENLTIDFKIKETRVPFIKVSDTYSPTDPIFSAVHRKRLMELNCIELSLFWLRNALNPCETKFLEEFFSDLDIMSVHFFFSNCVSDLDKIFSMVMSTKGKLKRISFGNGSQNLSGEVFMKNIKKMRDIQFIDLGFIIFSKPYTDVINFFKFQCMNLIEIHCKIDTCLFYLCKYCIKYNIFTNLISLNIFKQSLESDDLISIIYCLAEEPFCSQLKQFNLSNRSLYLMSVESSMLLNALLSSKDFIHYKSNETNILKRINRFQSISGRNFTVRYGKITKRKLKL
eukprot:snap_masked-scaffold_30-processed-gene-0.30-mRNA-1 protein AED:1.00 eAED:1.00 QI:0/0/0/0/1/1/3/0/295